MCMKYSCLKTSSVHMVRPCFIATVHHNCSKKLHRTVHCDNELIGTIIPVLIIGYLLDIDIHHTV